jgi:hypothetical protein
MPKRYIHLVHAEDADEPRGLWRALRLASPGTVVFCANPYQEEDEQTIARIEQILEAAQVRGD